VCCSNSIRDRASNRFPRSENARSPRDIAVCLRAFDLGHQPVDVSLQDFVEELEAKVDSEGGTEEGAVTKVERRWVGFLGESCLDYRIPGPGRCDCD